MDFIIKKRLETQVQDISTPSKPILSKSPQTSLRKSLPISPINFPLTVISHLVQKMASRFTPLALPTQLHDLPQNYAQRIKSFGNEGDVTTQQHLDKFIDFTYLKDVDHEDAIMILFSQSFTGELKKWFKSLNVGTIQNFN